MRLAKSECGKSWLKWNLNKKISEYFHSKKSLPNKSFSIFRSNILSEVYLFAFTPELDVFKALDEEDAYEMIHEIEIIYQFVVRKYDGKEDIPQFNLILNKELPTYVML